jgi:hypothetical protein
MPAMSSTDRIYYENITPKLISITKRTQSNLLIIGLGGSSAAFDDANVGVTDVVTAMRKEEVPREIDVQLLLEMKLNESIDDIHRGSACRSRIR